MRLRTVVIVGVLATVVGLAGGCSSKMDYALMTKEEAAPAPMAELELAEMRESSAEFNTESYDEIVENPFLDAKKNPLSTFSIDVDTASYANVRRFLNMGELPPKGAVRIEELVNYFSYDYAEPADGTPFSVRIDATGCPWAAKHRLARIALKGRDMPHSERPPSNLVFLLDVSGSMADYSKLPLLKRAMKMLVEHLGEKDRVAIVVYAGASGVVQESTPCDPANVPAVLEALERLNAGGSTHGSGGIKLAYKVATDNFIEGGTNRVILATDGDFNVGITNQSDLIELIEDKAKSGVFLTVLGFGMGNLKDSTMEKLADKGNGNYGYIDSIHEARKTLVEEMGATLITIAKDVKIQIEFNPVEVAAYRLIGYENRLLRAEDFNDDTKDAGEIGAGHRVTALYEIVPPGVDVPAGNVDALKYQQEPKLSQEAAEGELMTVKLRYKAPDSDTSQLLSVTAKDEDGAFDTAGEDLRFAAAVAGFGMLLRESAFKGDLTYDDVLALAQAGRGDDAFGYRAEFVKLAQTAKALAKAEAPKRVQE